MVQYGGSYATPRLDLGAAYEEFMSDGSEFIGTEILPIVKVAKQAAKFSAITRERMLSIADAKRASKAAYNRVDTGAEDQGFSCEEYGLEGVVDDRERALYMNDFDQEQAVLSHVVRKLKIAQEIRIATLIFNATTWTGSSLKTDVSSTPWATATSDVVAHVLAAKEKVRSGTGMEPNTLIIGKAQFQNLLKNDAIKAFFPGAPRITLQMISDSLAPIFGLERILVGGAVKNTADEGQTATLADVWSSSYAMIARLAPQGAPLTTPCVGRSFLWTPDSPQELVVETYREEEVRGDILRARHDVDEVVLSPEFAHLLQIA